MLCKFCVPRCHGNYTGDMQAHVFNFPREETLRNAWMCAVPRENLSVVENSVQIFFSLWCLFLLLWKEDKHTHVRGSEGALLHVTYSCVCSLGVKAYFQVCQIHFTDEDIIQVALRTDQATSHTITVPLSLVHLHSDAATSEFLKCLSYMSREAKNKEDWAHEAMPSFLRFIFSCLLMLFIVTQKICYQFHDLNFCHTGTFTFFPPVSTTMTRACEELRFVTSVHIFIVMTSLKM